MATRKSTRTFTPRQPAAEGPDVVYNGSDWDIYHDARYLGSRANSQDAWIEARRVAFDVAEETAVVTAEVEALDICPVCHEVIDSYGRCGCDYKPTRRSWIDAEGTPLESISCGDVRLDRVVGNEIALLTVAGRSFDVTSGDLAALVHLLNA